jgi:hypothetical protein
MKNKINYLFAIAIILISLSFVLGATTPIVYATYNYSNFTSTTNEPYLADSALLQILTGDETTCYYTESSGAIPSKEFSGNYGTKHEKFLGDLEEGTHRYYVRCGSSSNPIMEIVFKTKTPVYGEISLSKDPPLKEGQYEITLKTSKECADTPKLEYTLDGITTKDVSLTGEGMNWRGFLIIPGNVGESVGFFEFDAYDVYGTRGTKLVGDSLFIVDTIKPDAIGIINAVGYEGQVRLDWFYDEEVEEFNIYKSENPQVEYTDFYRTSTRKYYTDNNVERGKTYYYRVAGVDEAGNIADLSKEVYATALLNNDSIQESGLDIKLVGRVDNIVLEIESLVSDIQEIKGGINNKEDKEKELFKNLNIDDEITSVLSELNALKRDVEKYKLQDLTENELENKLNSARLRMDIIQKKTPEDLILSEEHEYRRELSEQNIELATLEYLGEPSENSKKEVDFVMELSEERNLNMVSRFYNLEVVYMDGSRKEMTVVEDSLNSQIDQIEDFYFIVSIPKNIVGRASELEFVSGNYEVVKEDPVLRFPSDTKKIVYYIEKRVSSTVLEDILLSPIKIIKGDEKSSFATITGNIIGSTAKGSIGIIVLVVFVLGLLLYFLAIKNKQEVQETLKELEMVRQVQELLEKGNVEEAKKIYEEVKKSYKNLSKKEKQLVIEEIKDLNGKLVKW